MTLSCQSCGIPLINNYKNNSTDTYCMNCADAEGNLHPREIVQQGIAAWLKGFAPTTDGIDFMQRADHYLKSMPAWGDN